MKKEEQKLIIDGNAFYEVDLECIRKKQEQKQKQENRKTRYGGKNRNGRNNGKQNR